LNRLPGRVAQLDGHAGQPELSLLDDARLAAAGFEVAPDGAGDVSGFRRWLHRLRRALRYLVGGDAGETEQGDASRMDRRLHDQRA